MKSVSRFLLIWCNSLLIAWIANARKLPPGIKQCSRNEPDFNACALKNGRLAIPYLIEGIPSYRIPPFDPLHVDMISIAEPDQPRQVSMGLVMKDVDMLGLRDVKLQQINIDLDKNTGWWRCTAPRVTLLGRYNVTGRVLLLPLKGHGAMNITLDNFSFDFSFKFKRSDVMKGGNEFIGIYDTGVKFNTTRAHLMLENLFGGERTLSDQINVFMNENWQEILQEMGPPVAEAFNVAVTQVMTSITRVVPYHEIFPDTPPELRI